MANYNARKGKGERVRGGAAEGTSCLAAVAPAEGHELPSACLLQGNEEGAWGGSNMCFTPTHTHAHTSLAMRMCAILANFH